jgi:SAM-dependent methyltransferase
MLVHLDLPEAGALCDPLCLRIGGWLQLNGPEQASAVEFWLDGKKIGQTAFLTVREDLLAEPDPEGGVRLAFLHFGQVEPRNQPSCLEVRVRGKRDELSEVLIRREIHLLPRDYRKNDYGVLLESGTRSIYHRENIYGSGPSHAGGNPEALDLLKRYLGPPPLRVLDIGCGLAWYGKELLRAGYAWCGAEVKASDCAELKRQDLPHFQVDGHRLPFADGAFDAAMCIEVLEHTENPRAFLAEASRVSPRRLLISVPNIELIPYLQDYQAVPWHLLEGDHKNFFTRWSLGALLREFYPQVEVLCYRQHPLLTVEGLPLFYHLFAVAGA